MVLQRLISSTLPIPIIHHFEEMIELVQVQCRGSINHWSMVRNIELIVVIFFQCQLIEFLFAGYEWEIFSHRLFGLVDFRKYRG
jgi:hypothetical protein